MKPAQPGDRRPGGYVLTTATFVADWPALLLLLLSLAAGLFLYPRLPARVPSHWNLAGQVDGYASRPWGAVGIPLLSTGIYLLMLVVPLIDPKRENYRRFMGTYRVLRLMLVVFFVALHAVVLAAALGSPVRTDLLVPAGVSLLFIVLGNLLGQVRHNYFVGIRTPWTLASETVWQQTHRVAAYAFVLAGLAGLVGLLFPAAVRAVFLFGGLAGAVGYSVVYSYLAFAREAAGRR